MNLATLMQRIEQGDREAFATLYARYNQTVYTIALKQTGSADEAVLVVKAVFKEMYQTIREKGPYLGDLYAWLDALTDKHLRLMWHRHEQDALTQRQAPAAPPPPVPQMQQPVAAPPPVQQVMSYQQPQQAYAPGNFIPPAPPQPKQYSPEEAKALEQRVDARLFPEKEEKEKKKEKSSAPSFIALSLFAVLLLWILIGLLSTLEILPEWDLGYQWFNETFFRLF